MNTIARYMHSKKGRKLSTATQLHGLIFYFHRINIQLI